MTFVGYTFNEYGTPVTACKCDECGSEFTVCPQIDADDERWTSGCLGEGCESYDESRDIHKVWDETMFFGKIGRRKHDPEQ